MPTSCSRVTGAVEEDRAAYLEPRFITFGQLADRMVMPVWPLTAPDRRTEMITRRGGC